MKNKLKKDTGDITRDARMSTAIVTSALGAGTRVPSGRKGKKTKSARLSPQKKRAIFDDVSNQARQQRNKERSVSGKSSGKPGKSARGEAVPKGGERGPRRSEGGGVHKTRWEAGNHGNTVPLKSRRTVKEEKPMVSAHHTAGSKPKSRIPVPSSRISLKAKIKDSEPVDILPELPQGVDDVDGRHRDVFLAPTYASDMLEYQFSREQKFSLREGFLRGSPVNANMRSVLVDWLTQVQVHLDLQTETLHLAVAMTDQILARGGISLGRLQLLGVTSLFVAAKFEERFAPAIEKLIHLTDNTYKYEQVISMEQKLLKALKFNVGLPTPLLFLSRYMHVLTSLLGEDTSFPLHLVQELSRYLLDLSLPDAQAVSYAPSVRAAAALYLSHRLLAEGTGDRSPTWCRSMIYYSTYTEAELLPCVHRMAKLLYRIEGGRFKGAWEKYSSRSQHFAISKWEPLKTSSLLQSLAQSTLV